MSQIEIVTYIYIDGKLVNGRPYRAHITGLTSVEEKDYAIAADGTQVAWDPDNESSDAASDFDFMMAVSDGDLDLETTTKEGDANEELGSVRLYKNLPFMLGRDDSYYNHSASDAFGGTLDVIDKVRADKPSSSPVSSVGPP